MIVPTQVSLPRNTVTGYDRELQQALVAWMRTAGYAINELANSSGGGGVVTPPPSPPATTEHTSRKRPASAVAMVGLRRATAFQPQLTAESGDDPGAARCVICLEALDLSAASSRGEAACGHTPCCGNYFHKRCLSQWLQGSGQSGSPLPIEKKCPTCRRDLVARALIPCALLTAPLHDCK